MNKRLRRVTLAPITTRKEIPYKARKSIFARLPMGLILFLTALAICVWAIWH